MELRHLRYFVAVVECGSISAAASRLAISQPPLGRQIKDLEEETGALLLQRLPRGVQPTPAGVAFYKGAVRILQQASALKERAAAIHCGQEGTLGIAYSETGAWLVAPAVRAFRKSHPGVFVNLHEQIGASQVGALGRQEIDLSIGYLLPALAHLRSEPLFSDDLLLAAPVDASRLDDLPFLTMPRETSPEIRETLLGLLSDAGLRPREVHEFTRVRTILNMVACGVGFSVVPASVASVASPGVRFEPIAGGAALLPTHAFFSERTPLVSGFLIALHHAVERGLER